MHRTLVTFSRRGKLIVTILDINSHARTLKIHVFVLAKNGSIVTVLSNMWELLLLYTGVQVFTYV